MSEAPDNRKRWGFSCSNDLEERQSLQIRKATRARLIFSVVLIAAGVLLFLSNLGILPIRDVWAFWPVLPLVGGIGSFTHARNASARVWGVFLVLFGSLFLLLNLGLIHLRMRDGSWSLSLILIAAGLAALFSVLESSRKALPGAEGFVPGSAMRDYRNAANDLVVFGAMKRKLETYAFQGGDLTTIFGSIEMDLRRCLITPPATATVLNVNCVFGSIKIKTPQNWRVHISGASILGNFEDKTIPPNSGPDAPVLVITGVSILSSVEIED